MNANKTNTDPSFVGVVELKARHALQVAEFERWALNDEWETFHSSHYDWWTFPIDRPSSYGLAWTVYQGDAAELKQDGVFVANYLAGVRLVALSWGWDVAAATHIPAPKLGQSWHNWPVRLFKAALSCRLFGYADLFSSLKTFGRDLLQEGEPFTFGRHDLSWLFTDGRDPYANLEK